MKLKKALAESSSSRGSDYGTGIIMGSGMTAGAAGLIAIMQALQGAQDNQERREYPLQ